MRTPAHPIQPQVARVYLRVSTAEQDLQRQEGIVHQARAAGYYVAGTYREKASGASANRPELQRMIADLQPGDVVIAEKIDRISRLPLPEAQKLIEAIQAKGARLAVPGVVDLSEFARGADGVSKVVLQAVQDMLLKLALQMAHDDYETRRERQRQGVSLARAAGKYRGRRPDARRHAQVLALRGSGQPISHTAKLTGYSTSQVKRICSGARRKGLPESGKQDVEQSQVRRIEPEVQVMEPPRSGDGFTFRLGQNAAAWGGFAQHWGTPAFLVQRDDSGRK